MVKALFLLKIILALYLLTVVSMDLHPKQREKMADMLLDLSKIFMGAFIVGPLLTLPAKPINLALVGLGVLCSTITWSGGIILSRPKLGGS